MPDHPAITPELLTSLPPSVLDSTPALAPPTGVLSNFSDPVTNRHVFKVTTTLLLCVMVFFSIIRVYSKSIIVRKASWDDLTYSIGLLGSIATYTACHWGVSRGPFGKHLWDVKLSEILSNNFLMPTYIAPILTPPTFLFIKLTFFLFYLQIFRPLRWLRISVYIGSTLTCAFYGGAFIGQLVVLTRRPGETWIEHLLLLGGRAKALSVPLSAVGLVVDIVLLALPIIAVSQLQLPTKRKIGILSIFMFGILACVGSILSIYYRNIDDHSSDSTWNTLPVEAVTLLEMNIGMLCLSLPSLSKTLQHHLPPFGSLRSHLSTGFVRLRSRMSGEKSHGSEITSNNGGGPSGHSLAHLDPYTGNGNQLNRSRGVDPDAAYEFGQLKSIHTYIGKGDRETSDDKIHLTHEIKQQHTNVGRGRGSF